MARFLAVKNFAKHQHYKNRRPPWIKFYVSTLDDYAFLQLPDPQQRHLMFLWQLAAIHDNRIPFDPKYIATAIKARTRIDFDLLIASGFLEVCEQDASTDASAPIAEGLQPASTHARPLARERQSTEAEAETEKRKNGGANGNGTGEAALLLRSIRQLAIQPNGSPKPYIPKTSVEALGAGILAAYEAVGGMERVMNAEGRDHSFLTREFAAALSAARSAQ